LVLAVVPGEEQSRRGGRSHCSIGAACGAVGSWPVESSVRDSLAHRLKGHPMGDALAESSYALARTLDGGTSLATAAVNGDLRANLMEIARLAVNGADELAAELSTPVREDESD
jgi:hypothetical protein